MEDKGMKIEETRETVRGWIDNPIQNKWVKAKTMEAADAYALAAHVDTCGEEAHDRAARGK